MNLPILTGMRVFESPNLKFLGGALAGIAIVAAVVAFIGLVFFRLGRISKTVRTNETMSVIVRGLELYRDACAKVPSTQDGLIALKYKPKSCTQWSGPYFSSRFADSWERDFIYKSDGQSYRLISLGADGVKGGEGDNKDIIFEGQK